MKRIRPLLALSFALSGALSNTYAASEYEGDIPAEVVSQLMQAAFGSQVTLYSDAPESFPPFEMPSGMAFVVAVDQVWSQRVILRSRVDHQASVALAYGTLLDGGWQLVPMPGMQMQQTGFIDANRQVPPTQLCHDQHGMLTVSTQSGPGATYVTLQRNVQPGMPVQSCAQAAAGVPPTPQNMPPEFALRQQQRMELMQLIPRMELPNGDGMTAPPTGSGINGSGDNEWEVRASLTGNWRIRRIYDHFAEQIEDQDWERDARVIGAAMASGSWTKTVEPDIELTGSLSILKTGEDTWDVRFRMLRTGVPAANAPRLGIRGIPAGISSPIGTTQIIRD